MASLSAQEKSTISTLTARCTFLVSARLKRLPAKVQGTRRSARWAAFASVALLSFSERSIISTMRS